MQERFGKLLKDLAGQLPALPEISLTSPVEIPVYVIHHGADPEIYEIICDFERFMTETQKGFFKRPVLKVWAGRADFERHLFARELRVAFARQFEALREAHRAERERKGWFTLPRLSLMDLLAGAISLSSSLVTNLLLLLATTVGRGLMEDVLALLRDSMLGRSLKGKTAEQRLEEMIEEKKSVIDHGLEALEIHLHPDLYKYAWRHGQVGPMSGMDRAAWPLPSFVLRQMDL